MNARHLRIGIKCRMQPVTLRCHCDTIVGFVPHLHAGIMDLLGLLVGVLIGFAGIGYGIYAKRRADSQSKGSMLGADEAPAVVPVLSEKGFQFLLMNEAEYPQFDIWVRAHDFAMDKVIDPTIIGSAALNEPMFHLPDLYPSKIQLQPFFEIDLRQRARARVNLFVHTRNAQSVVEVVAIRGANGPQIAYKQVFSKRRETLSIPDDFPIANRKDPSSLFAEDEPTGILYIKTAEGLVPAIPEAK